MLRLQQYLFGKTYLWASA